MKERCTKCNSPFEGHHHKHITRDGTFHTSCYQQPKEGEKIICNHEWSEASNEKVDKFWYCHKCNERRWENPMTLYKTTTSNEGSGSWKEKMMDDFCVMFERATRENEPIEWAERMEEFIENLFSSNTKEVEGRTIENVVKMIKTNRNPYMLPLTEDRFMKDLFNLDNK